MVTDEEALDSRCEKTVVGRWDLHVLVVFSIWPCQPQLLRLSQHTLRLLVVLYDGTGD